MASRSKVTTGTIRSCFATHRGRESKNLASLRKPAKGQYTACFRFEGRHYQRSLKTTSLANAQAALGRIKDTIHLLATGRLTIPSGVDPGDFIVTSG